MSVLLHEHAPLFFSRSMYRSTVFDLYKQVKMGVFTFGIRRRGERYRTILYRCCHDYSKS